MTKLTIIGAGSAVFTKNIVTDILSIDHFKNIEICLLYTSPSPRDVCSSRMPSSA